MKLLKSKPTEPTLSAHLLRQAAPFFIFPKAFHASRGSSAARAHLDEIAQKRLEWRKTFAPQTLDQTAKALFDDPVFLDQVYACDLLREVPRMVERTRRLDHLTIAGVSGEGFVCLRSAATCYVFGLNQAAAALARAAVEGAIRRAAEPLLGKSASSALELKDLLDRVGARLLTPNAFNHADKVRRAANAVLHQNHTPSSDEALDMVESARLVVAEFSRRPANTRMEPTRR
jgi:hypothetical protein